MAQLALDRDILRWLQGLDLAMSVRDSRRDFSSGYLIAEICSRYYPQDFQMHSYDNGTSVAGKRDNWAQLARAFARRGIVPGGRPLSRLEVEELVNCVPDTTLDFVTRLYATLTGRSTVTPPAAGPVAADVAAAGAAPAPATGLIRRPVGSLPPFARPTASYVAAATSRLPSVEAISDDRLRSAAVGAAVVQYEHALIADRLLHPRRYAVPLGPDMRGRGVYARRAAVTLAAKQQHNHPQVYGGGGASTQQWREGGNGGGGVGQRRLSGTAPARLRQQRDAWGPT